MYLTVPLTGFQTVNHFNTYFTSVASDLVGNLSNNNSHHYEENYFNAKCVLRETSQDEIKKILRSFNIFNKCSLRDEYPDILKRACVVLIFKSGYSNMASN